MAGIQIMDLLDRLNVRLVAAVDEAGPEAFPGGLTVADIYQRLIPYRSVRSQLGVVELAEYEHAMLRLLSGERHYVEVLDADVRLEIQRELASLNPILGIYRDYSSAPLRLIGAATPDATSPGPAPDGGEQAGDSEVEVAGEPSAASAPRPDGELPWLPADRSTPHGPARESGYAAAMSGEETSDPEPSGQADLRADANRVTFLTGRRGPEAAQASHPPAAVSTEREDDCSRCGRPLPDLPDVRFCPFCGMEQGPAPCATCGAPMERDWSFCTRCGNARKPVSAGVRNR